MNDLLGYSLILILAISILLIVLFTELNELRGDVKELNEEVTDLRRTLFKELYRVTPRFRLIVRTV